MSSLGDRGQFELISQLRGFLRDQTKRRAATATVERVGLTAVTVRLSQTGTRLVGVPVIEGVGQLAEGDTVYLLYLADNYVVALKTAFTPPVVATQVGLPFHRHVSPSASESSSISPSISASASLSPSVSASPSSTASGSLSGSRSISASPSSPPLPGALLDLQADLGVSSSGGVLTGWADQSGSGNHFTGIVGSPTLVSLSGSLAIHFADSQAARCGNNTAGDDLDSFTALIVYRGDIAQTPLLAKAANGSDPGFYTLAVNADAFQIASVSDSLYVDTGDLAAGWDIGTWHLMSAVLPDRSHIQLYIDGVGDTNNLYLGGAPISYSNGEFWSLGWFNTFNTSVDTYIRAAVVYSPALSDADRVVAEGLLRAKWGTP